MSFVGNPFRHDVFVSYTHGDVLGDGRSLLRQWSVGFAEQLTWELQAFPEIGGQINVFLDTDHRPDRGLDPKSPLSDALQQEIAGAAIFVILMSPHYLHSTWCQQERDWWIAAQREHQLGHEDRIVIARVWPTGSMAWPDALKDRGGNPYLGHYFYDRAKAEARPFSWPTVNNETFGDFRGALLDIVGNIAVRLREIRKELEKRKARDTELKRLAAGAGQVVYLHGRNTHSSIWDRVHRELGDSGYIVFPLEPEQLESDPQKIKATRNNRIDIMSGCDAVLLVGTDDASALMADITVIGRLDRQEAVARSNRLLPCGVVDTFGLIRHNPDWSRKVRNLDISWFDASVPSWIPQIQAWLHGATQ